MGREAGQRLLHYELVAKIGQGGMGSVWRARDTTLERDAAIKILPDELARDAQFLARFAREAKLLASLSHPNLAAVYGVHEADGARFLAMELVPGEDLSQRLERGPLPVGEAVRVATGIADALEAAHARGVVHRDLKPANVRLTPDGRVKVLDFGLAKAVEGDAESDSSGDVSLTATGVVLGTAPYMSPEQARGRAVDARTDLWSFGCVLWECLAGKSPFHRDTIPDLVVAILNDEPDWSRLPADTPPSIVRLLRRCLKKSRRERLHHIADARLELDEAGEEPGTADAPPATVPAARRRIIPGLVAVALVAALAAWAFRSGGETAARERALAHARFSWLTNFPGEEVDAAILPDGKFVTFLSDREQAGEFHAYVGRIGGAFRNVSRGVTIEGPKDWAVRRLGFQGGGEGIWLGGSKTDHLVRIPLLGGQARPWLPKDTTHAEYSPDGAMLLHSNGVGGDPVYLRPARDADGTNERQIPLPSEEGFHQHFPTWSPDGKWIYLVRGRVTRGAMDLWRVKPDGSGLQQLTRPDRVRNVCYPAPLDEHTVLFVAETAKGAGPWLWELDVGTRELRRATDGTARYTSISASRDGRRLVATEVRPRVGLFTIPILRDRAATESDVTPHPLPAVRAHTPRIRGSQLFYLSSIDGQDGLWRSRDGKQEEVWTSPEGYRLEQSAAISPDGQQVAIVERLRLWVLNADGSDPRRLMEGIDVLGEVSWSPNGEWIAAGAGTKGLYKVHVRDNRPERILALEATHPVWSPRDDMIVFAGRQVGPWQHLHAVTPDGRQLDFPMIRVFASVAGRVRFLPGEPGLVYLAGYDPDYVFRRLDLASMESRPLTRLRSSASMHGFDITPDGKTIVFDRQLDNADIVLIER